MEKIRLGMVDYLNCVPVHQPLEEGIVLIDAQIVKGPPAKLNKMFIDGELDITPISSIEYARHHREALILPDLCITADGEVMSISLIGKVPPTELDGRKVALTSSSATSVALLKILLEHYYQVQPEYMTMAPDLDAMLENADAALLIGDDALLANHRCAREHSPLHVTDLGAVWKEFTGEKMVYALWVIRRDFIEKRSEDISEIHNKLTAAKNYSLADNEHIIRVAVDKSGLPMELLAKYFRTIEYDFGPEQRRGLTTFYDYAYKSGLIDERVRPEVWGEDGGDF